MTAVQEVIGKGINSDKRGAVRKKLPVVCSLMNQPTHSCIPSH